MKVLLVLSVLLLESSTTPAQTGPKLVNEFDPRIGCETLDRSLDLLLSEAWTSESNAIVVIVPGNNVVDNARFFDKANTYARFRGFPAERYKVLLGKQSGSVGVTLWLAKNEEKLPGESKKPDLSFPANSSRIRWAKDDIQIVQIEGRDTYIGTGNPSCAYWYDLPLVRNFLEANKAFDVEFRVRTAKASHYRRVVSILKADFQSDGYPTDRIRFAYGGRGENLGHGGTFAKLQIDFVRRTRRGRK